MNEKMLAQAQKSLYFLIVCVIINLLAKCVVQYGYKL